MSHRLTQQQIAEAKRLLEQRPPVLTGTRVVPDATQRSAWYTLVTSTMQMLKITNGRAVNQFCDLAGVPD